MSFEKFGKYEIYCNDCNQVTAKIVEDVTSVTKSIPVKSNQLLENARSNNWTI